MEDETFCEEQLQPDTNTPSDGDLPIMEINTTTPESLRKILLAHDPPVNTDAGDLLAVSRGQSLERAILPDQLEQLPNVVGQCTTPNSPHEPINHATDVDRSEEIHNQDDQSSKTDYMQPINLESPQKRDQSRMDSAYFSAAESPEPVARPLASPRRSVAFASLPPRQPFAKKSMGPSSSHSRSSTFDASKSQSKSLVSTTSDSVQVKAEPQPTPQISSRSELLPNSPIIKRERISHLGMPAIVPTVTRGVGDYDDKAAAISTNQAKDGESRMYSHEQVSQGLPNPFVMPVRQNPSPREATQGEILSSMPEAVQTEDDDWLPRFVGSPRRGGAPAKAESHLPVAEKPTVQHAPSQIKSPTKASTSRTERQRDNHATEKTTPSAIRAAMQAASAKATSYLRQARTAFGSPSANHTKVFPSTTPFQSPPKLNFKTEPRTPRLYPEIPVTQLSQKPSMIPSKTPRKTPAEVRTENEQSTPRRSPRRSPKKGNQAGQSMAIMAARSATLVAQKDRGQDVVEEGMYVEKDSLLSPKKSSKIIQKFASQAKAKPLSIRVATASQREFENTKDRKMQTPAIHAQPVAPSLARSTSDSTQLDYLSKSQAGAAKRVAPSRQIKALAAANQAKEKAEKEQERREQQRKDMERKRQENARRQAEEEERRKAEISEENKKRKAVAESKTLSAKKQIRSVASKGQLRENPMTERVSDSGTTKLNLQPLKRTLPEIEETSTARVAIVPEQKRRCTEEQYERSSLSVQSVAPLASKPVRVSLQKKSLFGHPGEPGYKKPGTTTFTKSAATADPIKYSNETVRFSNNPSSASAAIPLLVDSYKPVNLPPSELIELPEINSDYSDSDDDEPPQKDGFERPAWANTPELRKLLRRQQRIDPDDVFGPIQPLQMEEIFKGKERALARFRPRSSSANWSGNDKLTAEEVTEYAKVMGYKN